MRRDEGCGGACLGMIQLLVRFMLLVLCPRLCVLCLFEICKGNCGRVVGGDGSDLVVTTAPCVGKVGRMVGLALTRYDSK